MEKVEQVFSYVREFVDYIGNIETLKKIIQLRSLIQFYWWNCHEFPASFKYVHARALRRSTCHLVRGNLPTYFIRHGKIPAESKRYTQCFPSIKESRITFPFLTYTQRLGRLTMRRAFVESKWKLDEASAKGTGKNVLLWINLILQPLLFIPSSKWGNSRSRVALDSRITSNKHTLHAFEVCERKKALGHSQTHTKQPSSLPTPQAISNSKFPFNFHQEMWLEFPQKCIPSRGNLRS